MKSPTFFQAGMFVLIIVAIAACKKQEVIVSPVAVVPKTVYSGDRNIAINASNTAGSGVNSKVDFLWSWAAVPAGADQPQIENPRSARTYIRRMPVPGTYQLRLQVSQQSGPVTSTDYRIEVLPDTLGNYPAKSDAGPDKTIYWPQNSVYLDGCGSALLNPQGRSLAYQWTQLAAPVGATTTQIQRPTDCQTSVIGLNVEGEYTFTLSVTNEAGSVGLDTVVVKVIPDTLKGKSMEFTGRWQDGLSWLNGAFDDVGMIIYSNVFEGRWQHMDVQVWDEVRQQWNDPGLHRWEFVAEEWWGDYVYYIVIFPASNPDPSTYISLVGKKARVKVTFR